MKKIFLVCLIIITWPLQAEPFQDFYKITTNKNIYLGANIKDLEKIPQNSSALSSNFTNHSEKSFTKYYNNYFAPWDKDANFDLLGVQKEFAKKAKRYSESYEILTDSFYVQLERNANMHTMSSLRKKAIAISNTNLRILPTNGYAFSYPNDPGEGYPFDSMQDDYLNIGEPLLISHYTKDGKFAYVLTSTGSYGFVLSKDLIEISDGYVKSYRRSLIMIDSYSLAYLSSPIKQAATIELYPGTILPLLNSNTILIPIRNSKGEADFQKANISKAHFISKPLSFNKKNVSMVIEQLIDKPYGWGGNLFHMDCARLVRNYFALFGIHMPLLSKEQAKKGHVLDISTFHEIEKKGAIIKYAIPYQSVIYLPGHIGIYLGEYHGEPIMLHALWGIKVFDPNNIEYRYIIGKSIISTLSPGTELPGFIIEKSNILSKILSISNLT